MARETPPLHPRRHAPLLVLDAREPGPPVAVDAFLRGARGARARAGDPRVYGHAIRDAGRLRLRYWLFYPDNPQDRGIVRSGRHAGDWETAQVAVDGDDRPRAVTFAQHSWRQGCTWREIEHAGAAPVAYVAHASHATYPRPATHDRPFPDPNDEARGRWSAPAAWHSGARSCAAGPPGHPWWVFAVPAAVLLLLLARKLRGRAEPAC